MEDEDQLDFEPDYDQDHEEDEQEEGMKVSGWACGSCACHEINELSALKDPKASMLEFCKQALGNPSLAKYASKTASMFQTLATHYLFIAGTEKRHAYGTDFATFIMENTLGEIATLPPKLNLKHHPDTTCQVWIWQPNQKALEAWYIPFCKDLIEAAEKVAKAQAEAQKKLREAQEAATEKEADTYAQLEAGAIISPSIGKIEHSEARTYTNAGRGRNAKGVFIPYEEVNGYGRAGYYNFRIPGGSQQVNCNRVPIKLGTAYKILKADQYTWEIAEVRPVFPEQAKPKRKQRVDEVPF